MTTSRKSKPASGDAVNHPHHYSHGRKIEPIDAITDWSLNFCLGNVVKYISRAGRKSGEMPLRSLEKAQFYLNYEVERLRKA